MFGPRSPTFGRAMCNKLGHMKGECSELKKEMHKKYKKNIKMKRPKTMLATWSDEDQSEDEGENSSSSKGEELCFMANNNDSKRERMCSFLLGLVAPSALGALPAMAATGGAPPITLVGGLSFTKVVAASLELPPMNTKVHVPAFTEKGEPAVFFSKDEMDASLIPFQFSVVTKMAYGRPAILEIRSHLSSRCSLKDSFLISALDNWHLLLWFKCKDDYLRVLLRESLYVQGKLFKIFNWTAFFKLSEEPSTVLVWVEFPALPLNLYYKNLLFSIAANVGSVVQIAHATEHLLNTKAARVCVEVDLLKPSSDRVWIGMGELGGYWQEVSYLNMPEYCCVCRRLGHLMENYRSMGDVVQIHKRPLPAPMVVGRPNKVWIPVSEGVGVGSSQQIDSTDGGGKGEASGLEDLTALEKQTSIKERVLYGHAEMERFRKETVDLTGMVEEVPKERRDRVVTRARARSKDRGTTFSCKGSVDTTISGVDTMAQSKDRNVNKRSTSVDTSLGQEFVSRRTHCVV
ncbi:hypothetical protein Taro_036764 [Colocasia esculenta]|uniref:DUF4283 domain-containing protein n=1 Tax=Colocasia esculenta TaxID=4460 RepID=A0A843W2E1_COLES|nr:hypothetical protein [Colocasia esculenta]